VLLFRQFFVRLENIRKCFTQKGGVFVLEEFSEYSAPNPFNSKQPIAASLSDPKTRQVVQRRYRSQMADQICYAVLCVFSYIAAGLEEQRKRQQMADKSPQNSRKR
jgi:hypothetical protein